MAYAHTGIFSLIENSHDPVRLVFSRLNVFDPGTFAVSTSCLLLLILSYTLRTTTLTAASRRYFPFKMAPLSPSDAFLHKTPRHYLLIHAGTERRQSPIASTVMCRLVGNGHTRECALALSFESIDDIPIGHFVAAETTSVRCHTHRDVARGSDTLYSMEKKVQKHRQTYPWGMDTANMARPIISHLPPSPIP